MYTFAPVVPQNPAKAAEAAAAVCQRMNERNRAAEQSNAAARMRWEAEMSAIRAKNNHVSATPISPATEASETGAAILAARMARITQPPAPVASAPPQVEEKPAQFVCHYHERMAKNHATLEKLRVEKKVVTKAPEKKLFNIPIVNLPFQPMRQALPRAPVFPALTPEPPMHKAEKQVEEEKAQEVGVERPSFLVDAVVSTFKRWRQSLEKEVNPTADDSVSAGVAFGSVVAILMSLGKTGSSS